MMKLHKLSGNQSANIRLNITLPPRRPLLYIHERCRICSAVEHRWQMERRRNSRQLSREAWELTTDCYLLAKLVRDYIQELVLIPNHLLCELDGSVMTDKEGVCVGIHGLGPESLSLPIGPTGGGV